MTTYTDFRGISNLQTKIMQFVDVWVHTEKTPTPRKEIVKAMEKGGKTKHGVQFALEGLLRYGYLRKAIMGADTPLNKTFYVQLRRV